MNKKDHVGKNPGGNVENKKRGGLVRVIFQSVRSLPLNAKDGHVYFEVGFEVLVDTDFVRAFR